MRWMLLLQRVQLRVKLRDAVTLLLLLGRAGEGPPRLPEPPHAIESPEDGPATHASNLCAWGFSTRTAPPLKCRIRRGRTSRLGSSWCRRADVTNLAVGATQQQGLTHGTDQPERADPSGTEV